MHHIRVRVRENRLSDPARVTERSYLPYVAARTAWVAEEDQEILGFGIIDEPARSVWALFVAPGSESTGVGSALHEEMLRWARGRRLARLWLSTSAGTRAERFYAARGWTLVRSNGGEEIRLELRL
jgi:GNAT superfamily N-acetyltransferase